MYARQLLDIERNSNYCRKKEHPFHESHDAVFCDKRTESSEIQGKKDAVADHVDNAHWLSLGDTAALDTYSVENQEDNTYETQRHTTSFLQSDRFFQDDGGDKHCENRGQGREDAGVERRRHGARLQKRDLSEKKAEHRGEKNFRKVTLLDLFLRLKKRGDPEKNGSAYGTEAEQTHRRDQRQSGQVPANDDVKAENRVGDEG